MKLWKALSTFVLLCVLSCCASFGQVIGQGITDATAQRVYLLHLSNMAPADQTAYLTNNLMLEGADLTAAQTSISNFKTAYQNAVTAYNNGVVAGTTTSNLEFRYSLDSITATSVASLQTNLSSGGYTLLTTDITASKSSMSQSPSTTMGCCYTSIETKVVNVISWSPLHVQVVITTTLEGSNNNNYPTICHRGSVVIQVGTQGAQNNGVCHVPLYYINLSATAYLDSNSDTCLFGGGNGCGDTSVSSVFCSMSGTLVFAVFPWPRLEVAYTMTALNGPVFNCYWKNGLHGSEYWCYYPQMNWCTVSNPDFNMNGQNINDLASDASGKNYWMNVAICGRFGSSGPWACSHGGSKALSGSYNPFSCTYHP